ncbi:ESX secretion-associated protein EspG [Pseudonocardia spinosispora]|uniref:ESX secretion-associated protein EspG n=1 Tax=Pseudonocardia spinosispora TaxID=103441 RepID=UPI0003F7DADF|nr:ESX secretion-associated protein EspG [Pseudonocardia spinosispora]
MTAGTPIHHGYRAPERRVLTAVEFDVLWEWLGLGATPVVLQLDSPGRTHSQRRDIINAGWHGLRERGLADHSGPDPEIVRLMHLLAAPAQQVELRLRSGHDLRAVGAGQSTATALAVRQDATVALSAATQPIDAALSALPPLPPGAGRSVTLPSADLDAASSSADAGLPLAEALRDRGVDPGDAELVQAILGGITGRGQLSVLAADRWGMLHRLGKVVGVLDTRHGRYTIQRAAAPGSSVEWTTLAPTDAHRLRFRVDELLTETMDRANRV